MQNFRESGFIMSFPPLLKLPITISEKSLIELVLSFTDRGNNFYMNYKDIAPYLGFSKSQSVKNLVSKLRKKGYISTKQSHNYNGATGGSSTSIVVNEELINLQLESIVKEENEAIAGDLTNHITIDKEITNSTKITVENKDNSLEFNFDKMVILCAKNEIINSLVDDFIPKNDDFKQDADFNIQLNNHLKTIFKNVVLQRSDFKEMYRTIELEEVKEESKL